MGLPVHVHPLADSLAAPKIQISPKFEWCTDEYRAKHNKWLLDRFGREEFVCIKLADSFIINKAFLEYVRAQCIYKL